MIVATHQPSFGVDPRDYHALGAEIKRGDPYFIMSNSALWDFDQCPRKWLLGAEKETTEDLTWGSVMDHLVTTPHIGDRYAVTPETYTAKGKKKDEPDTQKTWNWNATVCEEWGNARKAEGFEVVTSKIWKRANAALAAIGHDLRASEFITVSETQVQVETMWNDPATGLVVPLKSLLDFVPGEPFAQYLGDFKTTANATPRKWARHCFEWGLHQQAALYMDAFNAAAGGQRNAWVHIVQESLPPYITARRMLGEEFLQLGRLTYQRALARYCRCLADSFWPDYDCDDESKGMIYRGFRIVDAEAWMIGA